ncbi:DUF5309 domain-containing protein [Nitratireductor sp. ac15]
MPQPSNAYSQYDANNINEDLEQVIYDISPYDVPFLSSLSKKKATNIRHEWNLDSLAAAVTSNAVIEGDDVTLDASSPTTRVSNICQIMDKSVVVTGTNRAVDHAGYSDVLAYQLTKKGRELKRDTEATLMTNQASLLGDDTTARKLGSLNSWLTSNTDRGANGADGGYSSTTSLTVAATDGTAGDLRTFTEDLIVSVQQSCYQNGGNPSKMFMAPVMKTKFVNFAGIAPLRSNINQGNTPAQILGNAEVYQGPFGKLEVVVDRFMRDREVFLIDPEYVALGQLRPMQQWEIAKSGDSEKRQMLHEITLVVENEAAHGVIADLLTT